jgi:jumonji domain-containing protein 7
MAGAVDLDLADKVLDSLRSIKDMCGISSVSRISADGLKPQDFVARFVSTSTPVIITDALKHWPAFKYWNLEYLAAHYGDTHVTVNFTPNGWGDALVKLPQEAIPRPIAASGTDVAAVGDSTLEDTWFVMPEERNMSLKEFCAVFEASKRLSPSGSDADATPSSTTLPPAHVGSKDIPISASERTVSFHPASRAQIPYLSFQNDNLRTQLPQLQRDAPPLSFSPWNAMRTAGASGSRASSESAILGAGSADAVNLWIGDERSTSSIHKDHYDNLYAVVRGKKIFTLLPPWDAPWLYQSSYPSARYIYVHTRGCTGGCGVAPSTTASSAGEEEVDVCKWVVRPIYRAEYNEHESRTPWISINPEAPDMDAFPLYRHASPMRVEVLEGEVLFLPAMWFHQVAQAGTTIAVNSWFDMDYCNPQWGYFNMCNRLAEHIGTHTQYKHAS